MQVASDARFHKPFSNGDLLCPAALLHGVKVGVEMSKLEGTRTLYHSFLMKG